MTLLIPLAVAYVAYNSSQDGEIDEDITLEGKTWIGLLQLERELGVFESPVSTITFFDGSYQKAAEYLNDRVQDIIARNPWLGAWLIKRKEDKHAMLCYDDQGDDVAPDMFWVFDPEEIELSRDSTKYGDYVENFEEMQAKAIVGSNHELVNQNKPLWKVSIIPDAELPDERFALVVSMSHVLGDGHTFYRLYNMLSCSNEIVTLNPNRKHEYTNALIEIMGQTETFYLKKAISNPLWEMTMKEEDHLEARMFFVSDEWIQEQKAECAHVMFPSGGSDEQATTTAQKATRRATTVPLFAPRTAVSTNSIVVSWFFNTLSATVGLMSVDFRGRIPDLDDADVGNYQNPIPYTNVDYATPALIEQSLETGQRCGRTDPPEPLPGFQWDATFSMATNWTKFVWNDLQLGDNEEEESMKIQQHLHLPLYDGRNLKVIPNKCSLVNLFVASIDNATNNKRRLGALVVAPKSAMPTIESSGIVDEMIAVF